MFKNHPRLDDHVALEMLGNILDACGADDVSVSIETLTSYSQYRKNRYLLQKVVIIIMFVIFCILPFMFLAPSVAASVVPESETMHDPVVECVVDSPVISVRKVLAYMGDQYIPVYSTANNVYSIRPGMNGLLHITVTLSNGQFQTADVEITGADVDAPVIVSNSHSGNRISISVNDGENGSGINYDGVYAILSSGERIHPASFNEATGEISFSDPEYPLNVYVPDQAGNILHIVLTRN